MRPSVIDLSHHNAIQKNLKPARAAGILGCIHKATEGVSFVDFKLHERARMAEEAGMLFGAYHFIRPGHIGQQVHSFLAATAASGNIMLLAVDYEDEGVTIQDLAEFVRRLVAETGRYPVIYSGHLLKQKLRHLIGTPPDLVRCRLWLAQYGPAAELPLGWERYWLWQYTDKGNVAGISGHVDLNYFEGSAERLMEEWKGTTMTTPIETAAEPQQSVHSRISVVERRLDDLSYYQGRILVALHWLLIKGDKIMALIDENIVEMGETEGKVDEILTLVLSLKADLVAAGTDPAKLAALIDRHNALQAKLTAAGATPVPVPPEPAPTETSPATGGVEASRQPRNR